MVLEADALIEPGASREVPVSPPPARRTAVPAPPRAAFTVDLEDWYQSTVDFDAPIGERVVENVDRLLAMLDPNRVKATFFVQGLVARRHPGLIQRLVAEGHEIQSHAHTHRPLDRMDRRALEQELDAARKSVEDASGVRVTAFRAPDFSIVEGNLWALEVLAANGFLVDSSVFPVRTRRYGVSGWSLAPQRLRFTDGLELLEVPVAVASWGSVRLPVAGGGYFRLLPLPMLTRGLNSCIAEGRPAVVYCHPYEFNEREMAAYGSAVPWWKRKHQGIGRAAMIRRIEALLRKVTFGRLDHVLAAWGLT